MMKVKAPTLHEDITTAALWRGMNVERIAERVILFGLGAHTNETEYELGDPLCIHCKHHFGIMDTSSIGHVFCSPKCRRAFDQEALRRAEEAIARAERAIVRALCGLDPDKDDMRHKDPLWDLDRKREKIA
jgi:hypothetical protein